MTIKTFVKGKPTSLSTNFKSTEFDCHGSGCCTQTKVDDKLVQYLQQIRNHFGKPVNVSSGYRCETHNKNIGGATGSRHSKGQAADIYISGVTPAEIAKYAESIGILGIGLYETDADGHFVHVDTRETKSFWYGQAEKARTTFGGATVKADPPATKKELYRVRKSWDDAKSQLGAYSILVNAKNTCDKAGAGYFVFNSAGEIVYPVASEVKPSVDTSKVNTDPIDEKIMWDYFKSKGLNDYGIAGLMGNLYAESGLRPCNLQNTYEKSLNMTDAEYTSAVDSGAYTNFVEDKAGYGLAQWTYWSLKRDMLAYFQKKKMSIGDGTTQMEFLCHQLSTSYKSVWTTLQTAKTVLEASNAVLLKFERPADQSEAVQSKRASYGQKYFDKYGAKQSSQIEVPKEGGNGMKYSESNKPLICMQTQSTCYKGTSTMTVKGVLWHSTGANNPTLKRYVQPSDVRPAADTYSKDEWLKILGKNQYNNDWNHIDRQAGLNCWIGKLADGTVTTVQTMPWNYKPWGCGSGSKGSCNNGWIQFEICEDGLTDKAYFDKVYKEACELTAYLCDMYNIDPKGTVSVNGVTVPTILCHYDSHKLGLGSNHGDIDHWFPKHGKSMATVRDDVAEILRGKVSVIEPVAPAPTPVEPAPVEEMYRVRKSWTDVKSQIGAYKILDNAKTACDKSGPAYSVYNSKGEKVYPVANAPVPESASGFKQGDKVQLLPTAKYTSGKAIPTWVFAKTLFAREVRADGTCVISTVSAGPITGVVYQKDLVPYSENNPSFTPYIVKITADVLNVRGGAGMSHPVKTQVKRNELYTIVDESSGWGKLKSGAGWIFLDYTKKV